MFEGMRKKVGKLTGDELRNLVIYCVAGMSFIGAMWLTLIHGNPGVGVAVLILFLTIVTVTLGASKKV